MYQASESSIHTRYARTIQAGAERARVERAEACARALARLAGVIAAGGRGVAARYRRWRLERDTIRDLGRLDDRTLADIGVQRSHIRGIARDLAGGAVGHAVPARARREAAPEQTGREWRRAA